MSVIEAEVPVDVVAVLVEISLMKYHKILFLEDDGMFYRETSQYGIGTSDDIEVFGPFDNPVDATYGIHII